MAFILFYGGIRWLGEIVFALHSAELQYRSGLQAMKLEVEG